MPVIKSFDEKLLRLQQDPQASDFILADAKDADMAFGVAAPGYAAGVREAQDWRSLSEYRQSMREIVRQGCIDIMLMSASSSEKLTIVERVFDNSAVTPAVRANDSTDIWLGESGDYNQYPSRPFRTTTIDHMQGGKWLCSGTERERGVNLGLYSITLNNDTERDRDTLNAYRDFRHEAEEKGFRHFLEVFYPNLNKLTVASDCSRFMIDSIVRLLAGVTSAGRPLFLKMPYLGPRAMAKLKHYDPELIIGILGGSAGTSHDAFWLIEQGKLHGARAALFGRKINQAEDALQFVYFLRLVADEKIRAEDAVRAYHGELQRKGTPSHRSLNADLELTQVPSD